MKSFYEFLFESTKQLIESNPYQKMAFGKVSFDQLFNDTSLQENDSISIFDWMQQTHHIKNIEFICKVLKYIHDKINPEGLFPTSNDEKCFISTSAIANKINLTVANSDLRNSILSQILKYFEKKTITQEDLIEKVAQKNHELCFYPNRKNPITKKFTNATIHFAKAGSDKDLNKVSSDITEFSVAFALKLAENGGKNNQKVKQFLAIDDTQSYIDFVKSNYDLLKSVSTDSAMNSLVNGMIANVERPIIKRKVSDGIKLAAYAIDSINAKDKLSNTKVTNAKQKTDTADVETYINGIRIGYSVKADTAEGKAHSLKDFSVYKFVNQYPDFAKVLDPISFDKFIRYVNTDNNKDQYIREWNIFQLRVNDYARWMANNDVVKNLEQSMNDYKKIYADILKLVLNLDTRDTVMLTLSGIDDQKTDASTYALIAKALTRLENAFDSTSKIKLNKKEGNKKTVTCVIKTDIADIQFNMIFGSGADHIINNEIWQNVPNNKVPKFIPIYIKFNSLQVSKKH